MVLIVRWKGYFLNISLNNLSLNGCFQLCIILKLFFYQCNIKMKLSFYYVSSLTKKLVLVPWLQHFSKSWNKYSHVPWALSSAAVKEESRHYTAGYYSCCFPKPFLPSSSSVRSQTFTCKLVYVARFKSFQYLWLHLFIW